MDRKICLDSDILIELLNKNEVVGKAIESLEADFYVTPISVFEVWYGRKEKENISGLLESLHVLIFDRESAFLAADILRELEKNGNVVELQDIFIAAICVSNKIELMTNNIKHFERLKSFGLKLV